MSESRKYTKAQKQSAKKWDAANLDRLSLALPKGSKDTIKAHAEAHNESVNGFIGRAISETMERDTSQQPVGAPTRAANSLEDNYPLTHSKPHKRRQRPRERICQRSWPVLLIGR